MLNIDETGWKINFATAYIWCLCNPRLAWFHPNTSRAGDVIKAILGEDFAGTVPAGKPRTLQKRLERHQDEILTFARTPEVEYHNNRGERQLRPQVVNRKNSFGSASLLGALHTCILNSVVETCRLNSKKPVEFIRNILASARDALPSIFMVPATG